MEVKVYRILVEYVIEYIEKIICSSSSPPSVVDGEG